MNPIGEDIRVRPAHDNVEQQYYGCDDQGPERAEPEHSLEHHEPGNKLPGQVEKKDQGKE